MEESSKSSDSKILDKGKTQQSDISITSIPQIVLTESPLHSTVTPEKNGTNNIIEMNENVLKNTLTPPSQKKSLHKNASSNVPSTNSLDPLPLTIDLLKRKNKLDKLISQKEKQQSLFKYQPQEPIDYFSPNVAVDERVTAGLGISTPDASNLNAFLNPTSSLNSYQQDKSLLPTPNRNDTKNSTGSASLASPPSHASPPPQISSDWSYDLEFFRNNNSGSSMKQKSAHKYAASSVAGSSIRQNLSMRANSLTSRFMNKKNDMDNKSVEFERPHQIIRKREKKSKYLLVNLIYDAANRVVNSRAPESGPVSERDVFDFSIAPTFLPIQGDTHMTSNIFVNTLEHISNEKEIDPFYPQLSDNINSSLRRNNISNLDSIPNHDQVRAPSFRRRFSWISIGTQLEDKANLDYDSIYPTSTFEKKKSCSSTINDFSSIKKGVKRMPLTQDIMPNPLQGNTLFIFSPNNSFRILIWKLVRLRYIESFLLFLMIFHWFLLACVPIKLNQEKTVFGAQWTHYPILAIQCVYSLEIIAKIIAYGLIAPPKKSSFLETRLSVLDHLFGFKNLKAVFSTDSNSKSHLSDYETTNNNGTTFVRNHKAYLNSFGNCYDTLSVICYWIDFILMMKGYRYISLFKSLGALRPIRLLTILPGTAVILKSLEKGWDLLVAVSGLVFFFLLIFSLIALISFQGAFSRRCYALSDNNTWKLVQPATYCSGYTKDSVIVGPYDVKTGKTGYAGSHGYICPSGQICMEDPANIGNYGYVNYDTIFHSFLSVFTFVSLELWTDMMYQTQDADSTMAALFYCIGVYVISFILSFLLFAVITSAFARVRAESEASAFTAKKIHLPVLTDFEDLSDEVTWTFNQTPESLGKGVNRMKIRWWIEQMVKHKMFFYFGGFLVALDLFVMCFRSFGASEERLTAVDNAETAFTIIFAAEILLRMIGATTWMNFWRSKMNLIDLFLVITTCIIQLPVIQDSLVYKYLTIFQILRVYRLFACIGRVRRLVNAAFGNGENILYVMMFLVLTTSLCATVFMQMFGGDYNEILSLEEPQPRFDTFWESFVALIVVYTSERWTDLLYDAMASQAGQGSIYAAIAISLYFSFGRYVMSGLYIAVVLENFDLDDEYIRKYQIRDFINRHEFKDKSRTETILLKLFRPIYYYSDQKSVQVSNLPANLTASLTKSDLDELLTDIPKNKKDNNLKHPSMFEMKLSQSWENLNRYISKWKKKPTSKAVPINPFLQDVEDSPDDYNMISAKENREAIKESKPIVDSLFLFSTRSRFRYYCKKLVGSFETDQAEKKNIFNWFIMACVFVSTLMVILDEPSTRLRRQRTSEQNIYNTIEIILSIVFIMEALVRIVAEGFLLTPNAYLRNPWNQIDLVVIILNIITILMGSNNVPKGLSTFRSLRILRLIRYFSGVRDIFVSLFLSFPMMFDALIFTVLVLIPFAIYGVNLFGGLMWLCNDSSVTTRGECVGEYLLDISSDDGFEVNMWIPRAWQNPQNGFISFDNFPASLQHLFSLTSTEGWVDSMFNAMSTPTLPGVQPAFNWDSNTIYHGIFYIVFMIISQGTIQLFIGVIIEKFKERRGITTLTTEQRQYMDLQRLLASVKPTIKASRPKSKFRQTCYDLVIDKRGALNKTVMLIICLNIIAIASEFHGEPLWLERLQDYAYLAFTVIYVVESIIRILGLGWKKWAGSFWNWFDSFVAITAFFFLILRFSAPNLWTVRFERYCLIVAAFRLGEGIDSLQTLYHTIGKSLPSIIQVSAVFMVAMCLFAMLFMEFFGLTKYGIYGTAHSNFRDYGNALLLLVRSSTGEAWNAILIDYAVQYPNCTKSEDYLESDCGSLFWSYFLFDMFYIVCSHIFMNLFTAIIISNFEYTYETRTRFTKITKTDLRLFKYAWADIDTKGTGFIKKDDVAKLLRKLTGRFQLKIYDDHHSVSSILNEANGGAKNINTGSNYSNPKSPGSFSKKSNPYQQSEFNVRDINHCLSKMNVNEIRRRRMEYNIYYKEIMRAETSKGIPFSSVLTILSYRFIDISTSLTLDPLIARLNKLEQLTQEYYLEKASGFFVSQIMKRRLTKEIWKKRDEDEIKRLGINTPGPIDYDSIMGQTASPRKIENAFFSRRETTQPSVPKIVINDTNTNSDRSSPVSARSLDNPFDPAHSHNVNSLAVTPGSNMAVPSINLETDSSGQMSSLGGLSPYSPFPVISYPGKQNWAYIDSNSEMTKETSEELLESLNQNVWSDLLREEDL